MSTTEKWGYGFWLFLGLVFGIPESWAGLASPPFPSLSNTVAHLEEQWPPAAVIVVAVIVIVAYYFARVPSAGPARWPTPRAASAAGPVRASAGPIPAGSARPRRTPAPWPRSSTSRWPVLAYWFARDVPWPTLLAAITNLERRWRPAAVVVLAGLVILLLHLALPPWPDQLG